MEEWLFGWDATPRIVSVWASADGRAIVWRRAQDGSLVREEERFRPWILLSSRDDLRHPGAHALEVEELHGPGELRFLVSADDGRTLARAVLDGATRRLGRRVGSLRDLPREACLALAPEDQYLTITGRVHFRDLVFDELRRAQIDLETTGLDPDVDRVFLAAIGRPDGDAETLEIRSAIRDPDTAEADLIERVLRRIAELDPDVIENHNLHGFDLPFLARRAELLGVRFALGRVPSIPIGKRATARGARVATADPAAHPMRRARFTVAGRELIDTLDAVRRHDFSARDLPGHGLKVVAKHLG
ncbi:MAG: 3'-5' exonuclease, partial [Polyangiaceae bacterium]